MSRDGNRILAIAGSPRRHGNSEGLLDVCTTAMRESGAVVDELVVGAYDITPCQGCNACSLTGECVLVDDMRDIYARLDDADAIVVASPVYFASVPAVLKSMLDRMQPYWARRHMLGESAQERKRPGAIILVRGGGDPYGFQGAVYSIKSVFAVLGVDCIEELKLEGVDSPGDLGRHPMAIDRAREIGERMAKELIR